MASTEMTGNNYLDVSDKYKKERRRIISEYEERKHSSMVPYLADQKGRSKQLEVG